MIASIFIGVVFIIIQMVFVPQIENVYWSTALTLLAGSGYIITLIVAYSKEYSLKSRIKVLEDRVENNAEHIHKLVKKQNGKTIEYYTEEM